MHHRSNPATARLRESSQASCGQQRGQWIQEQNMTSADVHPAEYRDGEIDRSGHDQIRYLSSELEAAADQRNRCQNQETDQAQSGLDGQRDWKVPPDTVRIVVP